MAKILHVEDQHHWIEVIRRALTDHDLDSAESFDKAINFLESKAPYDLALVDLNLIDNADLQGGEILDLLRARHPTTRRVVVTGNPPEGPVRANIFDRYEVEEIIIKGQFYLRDLRKVVEDALGRGADNLPQGVKLLKSELRQRLRDWQRNQGDLVNRRVREAEEYAHNAERVHEQAGKRARENLDVVLNQRALFLEDSDRLDSQIDSISTVGDSRPVAEFLERLERGLAEDISRSGQPRNVRGSAQ